MPKTYLILLVMGNLLGSFEAITDGDRSLAGIMMVNAVVFTLMLFDVIDFV